MIINKVIPQKYIIYGLLFIVCIATILSLITIRAPFFLDDISELQHVSTFSSLKDIFSPDTFGLQRPIKNLIFMIVSQTGNRAVIVAHSILLVLYIIAIFVAFLWFRLWLGNTIWAVVATGVWSLAPTILSTVTWLSCANIIISTTCTLAGLICWEYAQQKNKQFPGGKSYLYWFISIIFYTCAFSAYEAVIIFPVLVVIQDMIIRQRPLSLKLFALYSILGLVTIAMLIVRGKPSPLDNSSIIGITHSWQLSFSSAFITLDHIAKWLWPFGKQEIFGTFIWGKSPLLWELAAAWGLFITIITFSLYFVRRHPMIAAGILWSIVALIPMCNFLPVWSGPFSDYYLTLSSIGLTFAVVSLIKNLLNFSQQDNDSISYFKERLLSRRKIAFYAALILAAIRLASTVLIFDWVKAWNDHTLLLLRSIQARPYAFQAKVRLARRIMLNNKLTEAEVLAEETLVDNETFAFPYNVLGDINLRRGLYKTAEQKYKKVIELDRNNIYAYFALAYLYDNYLNNQSLAEYYYRVVINTELNNPYRENAYSNLAAILGAAGKYDQAIDLLKQAIQKFPESKFLQNNMRVTIKRQQAAIDNMP